MSGARSRRKGQRAEQSVARYLRDCGWDAATTRAVSGFQQGRDIATDAPVSIEVKDHTTLDLAGWVRQAEANATDDAPGVVWHKRRGTTDPGDWYVTMTGRTLVRLLRERGKRDDGQTVRSCDDGPGESGGCAG